MIWRVVTRYAELAGRALALDAATTYALLDGVFEKALLAHLTGDEHASRPPRPRDRGSSPPARLRAAQRAPRRSTVLIPGVCWPG